jgi:hypothetical protein
MSTIPVARPVPRRLARGSGGYRLEVIRWQPIDRDVFSPVSSYVVGDEACLKQLSECVEEEGVLRDAEAIIHGNFEPGTAFELQDGKWVRERKTHSASPASRREPASIRRIESELEALRARVKQLEQLLQSDRSDPESVPSERAHE